MWTLPNALSVMRIAAVPVLVGMAWAGEAALFLAGFTVALVSDVADGFAARRLGLTSELGARLDSWGDLLLYAALPLCVWWLWPDAIRSEVALVAVAATAFALPATLGFVKFGRLTSYHTYGAKLAAWLAGGGVVLWLGFDSVALFRLAVAVLVLEALEEMVITLLLPAWHADVRTFRHAWALRSPDADSAAAGDCPGAGVQH